MTAVLDASALLALLFEEPGGEIVVGVVADGASVGAVNLAEVATVVTRRGQQPGKVLQALRAQVQVEPFLEQDALQVAAISSAVAERGLSLGDRACLALAHRLGVPAVTADRMWGDLPLDVSVTLIRA